MCDLCRENNGELLGCNNCGRLICFDVEVGDDVIRPAYVTEAGDLFCNICGKEFDNEDEDSEEFWDDMDEEYLT